MANNIINNKRVEVGWRTTPFSEANNKPRKAVNIKRATECINESSRKKNRLLVNGVGEFVE